MIRIASTVAACCLIAFVAAGCGSDDSSGDSTDTAALQKEIGALEQQVKDLKAANLKLTARVARQSGTSFGDSGKPAVTPANAKSYEMFHLPSGNIACGMGPDDYARCEVRNATFSPPPKPADCQLDWGSAVGVEGSAEGAFICHGDTVQNPDAPVLGYGESSVVGPIRCDSSAAGVKCENTETGHGFTLAKKKYQTF